jgi:hypothetical protein
LLEVEIAHGQRLVDDEDVGETRRHAEREAHLHAARIGAQRLVDVAADLGEALDVRHRRGDLGRRGPASCPVMYAFSRPVNSGWKPIPSSSSAAMRPVTSTPPSLVASCP